MKTLKYIVRAPVADYKSISCLFNNLDLILRYRGEILSQESFSNIYIPGMYVGGLYVGMYLLSLGDILTLWEKTEWHTSEKYYFNIIGTPLSGMNTAHWYNTNTQQVESGAYNNGRLQFLGLARPAFNQVRLRRTTTHSDLSIFDLVKHLSHQK